MSYIKGDRERNRGNEFKTENWASQCEGAEETAKKIEQLFDAHMRIYS